MWNDTCFSIVQKAVDFRYRNKLQQGLKDDVAKSLIIVKPCTFFLGILVYTVTIFENFGRSGNGACKKLRLFAGSWSFIRYYFTFTFAGTCLKTLLVCIGHIARSRGD